MSTLETAENSKAIEQVIKNIISMCLETDKLTGRERTPLQVLEGIRKSAEQELIRAQNKGYD